MLSVKQVSLTRGKVNISLASVNESSIVSVIEDSQMTNLISEIKGVKVSVSKITLGDKNIVEMFVLGKPEEVIKGTPSLQKGLILG